MRSLLYPKLAAINIRKHSRLYLPYLISSAVTIAMFYVMFAIANNEGITQMKGADALKEILFMGIIVIAIFSAIFLIYTNSFIVKQRTSEFGLYSVLGMEKRHIGKVMFFETVYSFLISLVGGLATGVLFYKLVTLLLFKLLHFEIQLGFYVSVSGLVGSAVAFGSIFLFCLIINVIRVRRTNAISLLRSKNAGEKEPRTKWILAILGVLLLGAGYVISIITESPLQAIPLFLLAVLCVIFGTYCIFIAGSIAVLKLLRKNKKYYYNVKHFNSVSGMLYRMKQNAAGLANICILSTMVLVMVSTTVSLYAGAEDALVYRYPSDISISSINGGSFDALRKKGDSTVSIAKECAAKQGRVVGNLEHYCFLSFYSSVINGKVEGNREYGSSHILCFMTAEDYNMLSGNSVTLAKDEMLVHDKGESLGSKTLTIGDKTYRFTGTLTDFPGLADYRAYATDINYMVVSDSSVIDEIYTAQTSIKGHSETLIHDEVHFDTNGTDEQKIALYNTIDQSTHGTNVECRQANRSEFYAMYGSFLFLGIVLGTLFLMVTVMIIYYKQISEGYDDKQRFTIMQQVGMSRAEVKSTIRSQVLTVFFLPLVTAFIHLAFSFPIICRLLAIMSLTNTMIFVLGLIVTALVFTAIYTVVYLITSKTYYKIVS